MEIPTQRSSSSGLESWNGKPIRIALTAKLRAGKDTFANYLVQNGFSHHKLSEGITEIISTYLPNIDSQSGKKREVYTTIGQTLRQLDKDIWVNHTWRNADKDKNIVISDVRQKNEEEFLRDKGFIIIGIEAPMTYRLDRAKQDGDFKESDLTHETEKSVDDIVADYYIQNDGTINQFYERIERLFEHIWIRKR